MNVSISEILVILLIALLVIRPEQLPEVAHALARTLQFVTAIFKKIKIEANSLIDNAIEKPERKREH